MCEASTKFKNATIKDAPYVNKIINNVESTNYGIKFPHLSMDDSKLQYLQMLVLAIYQMDETKLAKYFF